jgi:hypothetical protein
VDKSATPWTGISARLHDGDLLPYLGPGLLRLTGGMVPDSPEALAAALGARVRLPARARGNCWAAAQFIENRRFRATLNALMDEIFAVEPPPSPLHQVLAALKPSMIVDTWYDATMRRALGVDVDWVEIQGAARVAIGEDRWVRCYDATGSVVAPDRLGHARTILYKPHGAIKPGGQFLLTDADYVEVLTEIDIQTPIPQDIRQRRQGRGFLFLGCRFDEQTLRTFAREILKRSGGKHVAVFDDPETLTRNERRFLTEIGAEIVACPLALVARHLH